MSREAKVRRSCYPKIRKLPNTLMAQAYSLLSLKQLKVMLPTTVVGIEQDTRSLPSF